MTRATFIPIICVILLLATTFLPVLMRDPYQDVGAAALDPASGPVLGPGPAIPEPELRLVSTETGRSRTWEDPAHPSYGDVMVIVNDNSAISKDIATYFITQRSVPANNICNITTTTNQDIARAAFTDEIRTPVENCLKDRNLTDTINYLVTTKGVPLRVTGGNAAVDAELAMILGNYSSLIGNDAWNVSPYYGEDAPFSRKAYDIYLVNRLDGYTAGEAKALVDRASAAYGKRGTFVLDADSNKGYSPGGYGDGNIWIRDANTTLSNAGYSVYYESTPTFVRNYTSNVSGYASWGSNDGNYGINYLTNPGFETDTTPADSWPDGWVSYGSGVTWTRNNTVVASGTWSMLGNKTVADGQVAKLQMDYTLIPNARYWIDGQVNISSISGGSGVYFQAIVLDAGNNPIAYLNTSKRTTATNWAGLGQLFYEPTGGAVKLRIGIVVDGSAVTMYTDNVGIYRISPNFTWTPGAIAETYVSTGGRTFNYGSGYGQSLVADLVRDGVTGVSGHVFEPYLTACLHPDIYLDRYTKGYNLAESLHAGKTFVGWMETVLGDPKIRPYADVPDLFLDNGTFTIEANWSDIAAGDEVWLNITITNSGGAGTCATVLRFFDGNPSLGKKLGDDIAVPAMPAGQNTTFHIKWYPQDAGIYDIYAIVDQDSAIKEMRENNNQLKRTVQVFARPDLRLATNFITFSTLTPKEGDQVSINVSVENLGGAETMATGTVTLRYNIKKDRDLNDSATGNIEPRILVFDMAPMAVPGFTIVSMMNRSVDTTLVFGDINFTVLVNSSRKDPDLTNNARSTSVPVTYHGFRWWVTSVLETVAPGEAATFRGVIENTGNADENFEVTWTPDTMFSWDGYASPSVFKIPAGGNATFQFLVSVGAVAQAGDELDFVLKVTSKSDERVKGVNCTAGAMGLHNDAVVVAEPSKTINPGEVAHFEVLVKNGGNGRFHYMVQSVSADKMQGVTNGTVDNEDFWLDAGGSTLVGIDFATEETAPPGLFTAQYAVVPDTGNPLPIDLEVQVLEHFNATMAPNATVISTSQGATAKLMLHIRNNGNVKDVLTVLLEPPQGLDIGKDMNVGTLEPGQDYNLTFDIEMPTDVDDGDYIVMFKLSGVGKGLYMSSAVTLRVVPFEFHPDLKVIDVLVNPQKVKEGNVVTVSFKVLDKVDEPAFMVTVVLLTDGKEVGRMEIKACSACSGSQTGVFTWKATKGTKTLTVVVDPDDKWKEPDENDNKISVDIEVAPKGGSDAGTAVAGMGGIAIIGGVLVAVFLVAIMVMYMLSASRKRKRVEQEFFAKEEGTGEGNEMKKGPEPGLAKKEEPKKMVIEPIATVIIPSGTSKTGPSKDEKRDEEPDLPPEPSDEGSMGAPDPPAGHGTFAVAPLRMGPLKDEVPPDELDVTPETTAGESREEFTASGAGGPTMEAAGVEETAREEEEEELPPEPEPQSQEEPGVRVDKDAPPEPAPGPKEDAPGPEVKKETSASDDLERMLEELRKKREV